MSKEYLEALEHIYYGSQGYGETDKYYKYLKEYLESIDNSNPSEALKSFETLEKHNEYDNCWQIFSKEIKQALLKAKEQKHYLKWEDLEFKHKPEYIDVKMGDNKYLLIVGFSDGGNEMAILQTKIRRYYFVESEDNKQFFNDLHLERVEE